jgi:hypothetical protein
MAWLRLLIATSGLLLACAPPAPQPSPASHCYRLIIRPGHSDSTIAYFGLTNSPLPGKPGSYLALAQAGPDSVPPPLLTGLGAWYLSSPTQLTVFWPYLPPPAFAFSGSTFVLTLASPTRPMVGVLGGWTDAGPLPPPDSLLALPAPCTRPLPDPTSASASSSVVQRGPTTE